jgi:hypothetical protein
MPVRHFVHVIGFEVPASGLATTQEPVIVLLDKTPTDQWRAVFQLCVEELPAELLKQPPGLQGQRIEVVPATPFTRRIAGDIRSFVDRVNRMTFLRGGQGRAPG